MALQTRVEPAVDGGAAGANPMGTAGGPRRLEQLYQLIGCGKEIWEGVDPDEYVRKLREDAD